MSHLLEALKQIDERLRHTPPSSGRLPPSGPPAVDPPAPAEATDLEPSPEKSSPVEEPDVWRPVPPAERVPAEPEASTTAGAAAEAAVSSGSGRAWTVCSGPYRSLATHLLAQVSSGNRAVVGLIQPEEKEDLTGAIVRLGSALAERLEGEVLVVGKAPAPDESSSEWVGEGWGDVLSDTEKWREVVRLADVSGVSFLPVGCQGWSRSVRPSVEILEEFRRSYPLVLFDLGGADAHSAAWFSCCDGVYLLVRLCRTPRRAA